MITEDKVTELFCIADDFCKFFDAMMEKYTIKETKKRNYHRDSTLSKAEVMLIYGKLVADKGYIGKNLFERLFVDGIQLITKLRDNMKGALMSVSDKLLLRKRAIIETVNDELKNICQIEHTRHRSVDNFATNLFAGLIAYNLLPKKPSMNIEIIDKSKLIA